MVEYDDANLQQLFAEMEPKQRLLALKGAFRRVGNYVKKVAVANLRGSDLHNADSMAGGIRVVLHKQRKNQDSNAGFTVTAIAKKGNAKTGKGERGMHLNRRGLKKPVIVWAERGTKERYRNGRRGATGRMPVYGFLQKTREEVRSEVQSRLRAELRDNVVRIAKKYGCK